MTGFRAIIVCCALWAGPSAAEVLTVRSGDHDGFSRLVIAPPAGTEWRLGRAGRGYELRLGDGTHSFDASGVFQLITQTRIAGVSQGSVPGSLAIGVACTCAATAFETAGGLIVVDVAEGPPNADSVFEATLEAASGPRSIAPDPPYRRETGPDERRDLATAIGGGAEAGLPPFWRRRSSEPEAGAGQNGAASGGDTRKDSAAEEPAQPGADEDLPMLPDPRVLLAERDLLFQLSRAAAQGLVVAQASEADTPFRRPAARDAEAPEQGAEEEVDAAHPPEPVASGRADGRDTGNRLTISAQTSIDRGLRMATSGDVSSHLMQDDNGEACLADADVAVSSWGTDAPAAKQIADARAALVGEFDRPDETAVLTLARLYLHLGFGAEAAATLDAFGVADRDAPTLRALARIIDSGPSIPAGPIAAMATCDGAVALWALLAQDSPTASVPIAHGAVLRTFSSFPIHLRRHLGPRLANAYLMMDKPDVAQSVRDAIARAPGDHGTAISIIDAGLRGARGDAEGAERLLDSVAAGNSEFSAEALAASIRSRLDRGEVVGSGLGAAAGAMGYELGATPIGRELRLLAVVALASEGAFETAFGELARLDAQEPGPDAAATGLRLLEQLTTRAPEAAFVESYFAYPDRFMAATDDPLQRRAIAERLLEAGLADEARGVALSGAGAAAGDRMIAARAALAADRPEAALADLDGLVGADGAADPATGLLRAEALSRLGRHQEAAGLFASLGEATRGGAEAWRAGDRQRAATSGPEPVRTALLTLAGEPDAAAGDGASDIPADGTGPQAGAPAAAGEQPDGIAASGVEDGAGVPADPVTDGPVGRGRALVAASERSRAALNRLITTLAEPLPATVPQDRQSPSADAPQQDSASPAGQPPDPAAPDPAALGAPTP